MNLLNKVDTFLELQDKKKLDEKIRTSHHPSGANKCMRQLYYEWTREPVSDYRKATDCWRMMVGTWIHKMFAELLKEMGLEVKDEIEIFHECPELEYPIHGYMDNVIVIDGDTYGIELKSTFGRGIVNIQRSQKPREDDEIQSLIYLAFENLKGYFLDYLGRDSFYRTEFNLTLNDKQTEVFKAYIINRFKELEEHVRNKQLPPRQFFAIVSGGEFKEKVQRNKEEYKSDWQCLYCVYRSRCYEKEIEDFGDHYKKEEV